MTTLAEFAMYVCNYCGEFTGKQFSRYLRHIKFVGSNEPNFRISCTHCEKSFKKFQSFRLHLQRKHKHEYNFTADEGDEENFLDDGDDAVGMLSENEGGEEGGMLSENEGGEEGGMLSENEDENPDDSNEDTSIENITKFIALFVLKTKEVHMVSQPTIDSILDNTKTLVGHCLESLSRDVKSCLAQNGVDWTQIDGLKEVFKNQEEKYQKALDPICTEYLQVKYIVDKLHYVVSI